MNTPVPRSRKPAGKSVPVKPVAMVEVERYLRIFKETHYGGGVSVETELCDEIDHDLAGVWVEVHVRIPEHAFESPTAVAVVDLTDAFKAFDPTVVVADLLSLRGSLE